MAQPANAEEVSPNIGVEGTSQYYGEMRENMMRKQSSLQKIENSGDKMVKKMAKRVKMDLAQQ